MTTLRSLLTGTRAPAVLLALVAAGGLRAQDGLYIYALSEEGRISVNGVTINDLKGGFDLDSFEDLDDIDDFEQVWQSLAVDGPNRWALRWDGRVSYNGNKLDSLAFDDVLDEVWIDLAVIDGEYHALRTDGRVVRDGSLIVEHNDGEYHFTRLLAWGGDHFALRSDGRVFRNTEASALFAFDAGGDDGDDDSTKWIDLAVDPTEAMLYALRRDGKVIRGDLALEGDPDDGTVVAALPFGSSTNYGTVYHDLEFLPDGTWLALRGNGQVYEEGDVIDPILDLPGDPDDDVDDTTVALLTLVDDFIVMARDGKLYQGSGGNDPLINLPKNGWMALTSSSVLPDLSSAKNNKPVPAKYTTFAITGEPVSVPLLVVDEDKPADELTVTIDEGTVPAGAVWDPEARVLAWDDPGPAGKYKVKLVVSDGEADVKATITIKVKDPDDNPDKNKKPRGPKVKKLTALKGVPLELPIVVVDEDGDALTISVDEESYPFDSGAVFDAESATFLWTPTVDDFGTAKIQFLASDGDLERKIKVKIKVENTLLAL